MPAIDAWVLESALRQLAAWSGRAGAPPVLSINISGEGLRDAGFADRVARALLGHGIAAARLEIEIPEDLAVRDLPEIAATLERLHALGVRLALDDFGGGRSSLPHVVQLPVHRLKLDRSIVAGLPEDSKDRAVLHATMALARGMGIEVLGEGVETEGQAFALRRAGCHVLQGWLIGRPVPAAELVPEAGALRARA
jgi:EAL domain-containing protein (putative c-di-GMP-specific phosphodiesterase class I)